MRKFLEMLVVNLSATSAEELRHPTRGGTSADELRIPMKDRGGNARDGRESGLEVTQNNRARPRAEGFLRGDQSGAGRTTEAGGKLRMDREAARA